MPFVESITHDIRCHRRGIALTSQHRAQSTISGVAGNCCERTSLASDQLPGPRSLIITINLRQGTLDRVTVQPLAPKNLTQSTPRNTSGRKTRANERIRIRLIIDQSHGLETINDPESQLRTKATCLNSCRKFGARARAHVKLTQCHFSRRLNRFSPRQGGITFARSGEPLTRGGTTTPLLPQLRMLVGIQVSDHDSEARVLVGVDLGSV